MHVKENLLTELAPFHKTELWLHVTAVEYLEDYKLRLQFNNGIEAIVDLELELYGEIFEPLKNQDLFQQVFLTGRTIEWPNGADFSPEFLFDLATNKRLIANSL